MVFANFDPWLGSASLSYANPLDPKTFPYFRVQRFNMVQLYSYMIHICPMFRSFSLDSALHRQIVFFLSIPFLFHHGKFWLFGSLTCLTLF